MGKIDDATNAFLDWCHRNTPAAKFQHTVVQGIVGIIASILTMIVNAPTWVTVGIIPTVMAILTPAMAEIGKNDKDE